MSSSVSNFKRLLIDRAPRLTLGSIFLIGALDGFAFIFTGAHLIHPPTSEAGLAFEAALKGVGFLWPLMKSIELIGAVLLLSNRAPALGLALLAPIMAIIVLFHAVLNPGGLPLALILVVCGSLVLWIQRPRFAALFDGGTPRGQTL
ncbi:MAG: DoxX family protein [Pseudomonadota bacterium]